MPHQKTMLAVLLAGLSATSSALADDGQATAPRAGGFTIHTGAINASGPGPFTIFTEAPRAIVNAPYSAQMVTEHQQNLADGNQIVDRQTSLSYRDSAGRTRQEGLDSKGEPTTVTINDPVAGVRWVLNAREHTGVKLARPASPVRIEQRKRDDGQADVIVKKAQRTDVDVRQDVRIEAAQLQAPAAQGTTMRDVQIRLAPLTSSAFGDMKWSLNAETKKLGTREMNGVQADGTLRSYEIPAGAIGNRNPITVSDENWYARDLQITMYTKHSDPRSGDVEFRVEKLKREEPPAALFTVPADYKVRDAGLLAGQGR